MKIAARLDGNLTSASAIAWEECACLLCGSTAFKPMLEANDTLKSGMRFLVVRCDRCGLYFTNPRPDAASMGRFYPDDYPCHRIKAGRTKADALERWLPARPGRLLDFGCGAGGFLLRMRGLGWDVAGLDVSESVGHRLRAEHGLNVHAGTLPSDRWPSAAFEAITMRQALEHVHAPLETLRAAWRLLTPGGRLLVSVPNFAALAAHWFGSEWYGLDLPRHLTHFTPHTLRSMLTEAGFRGVDLHQQAHASWIRHSAQRGVLTTRLGSGIASRWASMLGRAEALLAVAVK